MYETDWYREDNGLTLLNAMKEENLEEVRQILIQNPPVIDEEDENGVPMSFLAAETGNFPIVKYIVEYSRASFNTVDPLGRNILHFAVMGGNLDVVRYLVEKVGMSPVSGDRDLVTPYDLAHRRPDRDIEEYFAGVTGMCYEDTYHNPVRTGMFPDPSIVRVGEDYYMVNSSFIFFPCIPISHSRDLIHWRIIGHAITEPSWAELDGLEGGRGYWAPDISYYKGRFYMAATYRLNDTGTVYRRQMIVSSDKPEGPYSKPVFIEEDGIDPSIFNDEDGRRYMLLNRGARIFELNEDATAQISEARLLYYGDYKRAPEGPHLLKKDGWYYLFEAEGGTGSGHRITVSRSRTLFGNYEPCPFNPIMRQQDERAAIQCCGHGKPVCTQDGDWYMVYLCSRTVDGKYGILGRETCLDPITWTADGWPMVNHLRGPGVQQKKPFASGQEQGDEPGLLENGVLSNEWVTPRPAEAGAVSVKDGILYLKGSRVPLTTVEARNILVRRQKDFCFTAETLMEAPALLEDQEAGLICYYDENTWVSCGFKRETHGCCIQVREHVGDEDRFHKTFVLEKPKYLKLKVTTSYLARRFSFILDPEEGGTETVAVCLENVSYLSSEGFSRGKRFTGAMVGVYAYGGDRPLVVGFREFVYGKEVGRS